MNFNDAVGGPQDLGSVPYESGGVTGYSEYSQEVLPGPSSYGRVHDSAKKVGEDAPEGSSLKRFGNWIADGAKAAWEATKKWTCDDVSKAWDEKAYGRATLIALGKFLTVAAVVGAIACPIAGAACAAIYGAAALASCTILGAGTTAGVIAGTGMGVALGGAAGGLMNWGIAKLGKSCFEKANYEEQTLDYDSIIRLTKYTTCGTMLTGAAIGAVASGVGLAAGASVL